MKNKKPMKRIDIHKEVTDEIIAVLEEGVVPWVQTYDSAPLQMPLRNDGNMFSGINALRLMTRAYTKGYSSPYWFAFKQLKSIGCNNKGQSGTHVTLPMTYKKIDEKSGEEKTSTYYKTYNVWNADQLTDLPDEFKPKIPERNNQPNKTIDEFGKNTGIKIIVEGAGTPHYNVTKDYVSMPHINCFHSSDHYAAALAHELSHASGAKHRLNRPSLINNDTISYCEDEVVADLSAGFLMARLGLKNLIRDDHAPYIDFYLKKMKKDSNYIFEAAHRASEATNYLIDLAEKGAKSKVA